MFKKLIAGSIAAIAAIAAVAIWKCTRWWRTWGVRPWTRPPTARRRPDRGAQVTDTRGITIAAPPEAVWPWLVQMGYGRAGWYSYDKLDMRGSLAPTRSCPSCRRLAVGDIVPTDPVGRLRGPRAGAGPGARALRGCRDGRRAHRRRPTAGNNGATPAGLSGLGQVPRDGHAARTSRRRGRSSSARSATAARGSSSGCGSASATATGTTRAMGPFLGFGVFVMAQRQMRRDPRARGAAGPCG